MELRTIIKSTSFLITSKIFQFFVSLIKAKLGAIYLGTSGIGIYNQVQHLTSLVSRITLLSMNDGLVKLIAQNKGNEGFEGILKGLLKSYSVLIIFSVFLAFSVCLIFAKQLTIFFLGDYKYLHYYLWGVGGVPVLIINSLSFAILKSYKATKKISRANILSSFVSLCFFIPMVYFFNVLGAIITVFFNFTILLVINNFQARQLIKTEINISFRKILVSKIRKDHIKELLNFAIFGASSGLIYLGSESVCRSLVVNCLGVEKLGLYAPVLAWSGLLTGFILPSVQVYLYPRYSEAKNNEEITGVLNDFLYLITLLIIPFLFIAISYKSILIPLFYSDEFIEAEKYLPWHFIGISFYMWWYVIALILNPIGKIKTHSIFMIIMAILNVAIVYYLVPLFGLYGWMAKFIISPILFLFINYIYLYYLINLRIVVRNILLMLYALLISIILVVIDEFQIKYWLSILFIFLTILFVSKKEKKIIMRKIKSYF